MDTETKPTGMKGFTIVWFGQLVSLLGSGMTQFALTIWAWQFTGEATALALVGFFTFAPSILISPLAGALVDRWDRKKVMMLSDLAAGLSTIAVFFLFSTDSLEIWHLYVTGAFAGVFQSFQFPAYSAAISVMLDKEQYSRASGMISLAEAASGILAPIGAGIFFGYTGIPGILLFDVVTFIFAIGTLLAIYIPKHQQSEDQEEKRSLLQDSLFGFRYIFDRPSLLGVQLVFLGMNLVGSFAFTLLNPMILARTGNDTIILASVQSSFGAGGLVGGILMSVWGGPEKRIYGLLGGLFMLSLFGGLLGIGQSQIVWMAAAFLMMLFIPILNGCSQALWMSKVPPEFQGRVFATRRLIAQISQPLAMILTGPLADWVFEPAMQQGGSLADVFGWLVGTGAGAGMALIFVFMGISGGLISLIGYSIKTIRDVEELIPDFDSTELQ